MLDYLYEFIDKIKELFADNVDTVETAEPDSIVEGDAELEAGDVVETIATVGNGGTGTNINNVLDEGIKFEDSVEPGVGQKSDSKNNRFIPFIGAVKCNLCVCKQYVGENGLGNKCVCGHDYGDHEWV